MKWPNTLTALRHGESAYNILKQVKDTSQDYQEFREAFEDRQQDPQRTRKLAERIIKLGIFKLGTGNHDTAITEAGRQQARATGERLPELVGVPDVVLVSPYDRTLATLEGLAEGWPALRSVPTVEFERLREQEHGLAELYGDWRIFHTMHPEQDELYSLQGPYWYRYPQGENVPDVRERMRSTMNTVMREYIGQDVMMVTHHLSILALRAHLERLSAEDFIHLDNHEKPVNCGVTVYRGDPEQGTDGKLLLDLYNQRLY